MEDIFKYFVSKLELYPQIAQVVKYPIIIPDRASSEVIPDSLKRKLVFLPNASDNTSLLTSLNLRGLTEGTIMSSDD